MSRLVLFIVLFTLFAMAVTAGSTVPSSTTVPLDWDENYSFINSDGEEVNLHLAYGREKCEVHRTVGANISFIIIKEESDNIAEGKLECRKLLDYKSGEAKVVSRILFHKNEI